MHDLSRANVDQSICPLVPLDMLHLLPIACPGQPSMVLYLSSLITDETVSLRLHMLELTCGPHLRRTCTVRWTLSAAAGIVLACISVMADCNYHNGFSLRDCANVVSMHKDACQSTTLRLERCTA